MAVIKLGNTKVASRLLSYCEKRAVERDGVQCDTDYAKSQFKATRELFGKSDGVQAHHVIQSFSPEDDITPIQANEIGRKLAEQIAPGHECAIYTHSDKAHLHNHIVINSVSFEDGKKYNSDRKQLYRIREQSNALCKEYGFELVKDHQQAKERFSQAEYKAVERGEPLWKDQLRTAVDEAKLKTLSLEEMKSYLKENYNIEMKIQNKNVSFKHPEKQRFCRGKTLGANYTKGAIDYEHEYKRESNLTNERKLKFNEHVFRSTGTDRGENERYSNGTIQRNQKIHDHRIGIGESAEGQKSARGEIQRDTRTTGEVVQKLEGRSQQKSERPNPYINDRTQNTIGKAKSRPTRTSGENEITTNGTSGTRDEIQTRTQTNNERNIDGQRIEDRGYRDSDISSMGSSNTSPSVSGADLLNQFVKSMEQSVNQMEAKQQKEISRRKQQSKPKTRTQYQELDGPER